MCILFTLIHSNITQNIIFDIWYFIKILSKLENKSLILKFFH
jgi:hypothetical protein